MRRTLIAVLFGSLVITPLSGTAQETVAKSKIVSVGVFKNGLALVQQEIQVPGAGTYRLDTAPEPVHGTFWIKSNCQVESSLKLMDFESPRPLGGLQEELAGKEVVIHLKDNKANLTGTVEQAARSPSGFIVLKTATGFSYINSGEIAHLEVKGVAVKNKENTVKQQRPVLVLTVAKTDKKPVISLSYLTHGFSWAPS